MKQVHEILTGTDFSEFDRNHGQFDRSHYQLAMEGKSFGIQSVYDSLASCARGIDRGGNGSTHAARKAAAQRCIDQWPMARVACHPDDAPQYTPIMQLHVA